MPRKTLVVMECDRCKNEGDLFEVKYPEGVKEFILCERHSGPLVRLKEADYGTWKKRGRRPGFKKVDIADLENPGK